MEIPNRVWDDFLKKWKDEIVRVKDRGACRDREGERSRKLQEENNRDGFREGQHGKGYPQRPSQGPY